VKDKRLEDTKSLHLWDEVALHWLELEEKTMVTSLVTQLANQITWNEVSSSPTMPISSFAGGARNGSSSTQSGSSAEARGIYCARDCTQQTWQILGAFAQFYDAN
jgi:hypothetical protein